MGISRQITEAGIRATQSNSDILKKPAFSVDRHCFSVHFFFVVVKRGSDWKLDQGKFCLVRREKCEALCLYLGVVKPWTGCQERL